MVKRKRTTKIMESLNALNKNDIYSMMLFTLYKMQDDPKYSALSELSYILDGDSLSKFLRYYGGMTIKVPTLEEMRLVTQGLMIYQYVNLEEGSLEDAIKTVSNEFNEDQLKDIYVKISNVIANYEFERN